MGIWCRTRVFRTPETAAIEQAEADQDADEGAHAEDVQADAEEEAHATA